MSYSYIDQGGSELEEETSESSYELEADGTLLVKTKGDAARQYELEFP